VNSGRDFATFSAAWVLPMSGPPLAGGAVTIADGRIAAAGSDISGAIDLGRRALLPGLVNAHTHLELSHLRGRIPRASRFTEWVRPLLAHRRMPADARDVESAASAAIAEARASGTAVFGDVSNSLATVPVLRASAAPAHVFHELLGFNVTDPAGLVAGARKRIEALAAPGGPVRLSLAAHAPYSVAPALFEAIRADATAHGDRTTVHLAESAEEVQLLADGSGPWRSLLEELGVWSDSWQPPGASPVAYLYDRAFLDRSVLAVHAVQCTGADVDRLRACGATVVSCPRSNAYVGAGAPPLEALFEAGVPVAFGTDSLASVDDLNLFSELAEARRLAPRVPARALLSAATTTGARALGFGDEFGTLEPGKRASIVSVRIPDGVTDVEEYLLSGIEPADVAWVPDAGPAV
jgi:cytosine/adenosine deaminase-related metal-dependent hydrolase